MKSLFKQILKAFLKNSFLVFGLLILLIAALFISTTSIQIVSVLNSSVNGLNNAGNLADATSKAINSFGSLVFSYDLQPVDSTKQIMKSSLQLQGGDSPTWNENRIYPYRYAEIYNADGSFKTRPQMGSGLNYNSTTQTITINETDPNGFWTGNYGTLTTSSILPGARIEEAISFSFYDQSNKLLFDPQTVIFTQYGAPIFSWNDGAVTSTYTIFESFAKPNQTAIENDPNFDPAVAFTRCQGDLVNQLHKGAFQKSFSPTQWKLSQFNSSLFGDYALGLYSHKVTANTYAFNIDWQKSRGPIKQLLTTTPEFLTMAFNDYFENLFIGAPTSSDITNFIEIENDTVFLNLDDSYFGHDQATIQANKEKSLKNFATYLNTSLTQAVEENFFKFYSNELAAQNIDVQQAMESFYKEGDIEYLFVLKDKAKVNNLVIDQGVNLGNNEGVEFLKNLDSTAGGFASKSSILAFIEFAQNANYGDNSDGRLDFLLACVKKFGDDLKRILTNLPTEAIPQWVLNSPIFARFAIIYRGVVFDSRGASYKVRFNWNAGQGYFSFISNTLTASWTILDNVGVVLNTAYIAETDKRNLPTSISQTDEQLWIDKVNEFAALSDGTTSFKKWLIDNKHLQAIPWALAVQLFQSNQTLFFVWMDVLSSEYTINYQGNSYIIIGSGNAPDFAFPIISPTSPIPNPKLQAIIYMNQSGFNTLGLNKASISSYYAFQINKQSLSAGINQINNLNTKLLGEDVLKALPTLENQDLGTVWLRTYFPVQTFVGISTLAITACIILILLSIFVIFLLFRALTQNIMPSLAICMANGVSFAKIFVASLMNVGIITTIASLAGYIVGYFTQASFLNILSSIWFLPQVLLGFSPWLLIGGIVVSFAVLAGIFFLILRSKFKRPIPEILANKESLKTNALNNVLRQNTMRISSIAKLSYGLSSTKLGRILLLSTMFSVALGASVSSIVINDKFVYSQAITNQINDFNYGFDLTTPNEFAGLYKSQPYDSIGFTDESKGINSIYDGGRYPYTKTELKTYNVSADGKTLDAIPDQYFGNLLLPSYQAYNDLGGSNINFLYDTVASLFLLDTEFSLLGQTMPIWDTIKSRFPSWIVYQLESHLSNFKTTLYDKYTEYYSQFLKTTSTSIANKSRTLEFANITLEDQGIYQASFKKGFFTYTSVPTFVWVDNKQIYTPEYSSDYPTYRVEATADEKISFQAQRYTNSLGMSATPTDRDTVNWTKATVNDNLELDPAKTNTTGLDLNKLKYNNRYLTFLGLIYADPDLAELDSKISFGIIPLNEKDEKYTKVNANFVELKRDVNNTNIGQAISILGIQPQSQYVNLINNKNEPLYTHFEPNQNLTDDFNIIINNGAAYKYKLGVGDEITLEITNDAYNNSIDVMNNFIKFNEPLTSPQYTFKIAAIVDDSYDEKFYLDLTTANKITSLSDIQTTLNYTSTDVERTAPLELPFNGVFTDESDPALLLKGISFYSNYGFWNQTDSISSFDNISIDLIMNMYVSKDANLLQTAADEIKTIDPNFDNTLIGENLRQAIISYLKTQYTDVSVINEIVSEALNNLGNTNTTKMINSHALIDELFTTMSSLSTALIMTSISILAPILVLVSLVCMLSLINDYLKLIGLMRVLGFSQRNITWLIASIFLPIAILTIALGLGFVFATTYGLQFIIYNLTQIFISPNISAIAFFIGLGVIGGLILVCILFLGIVMRRTKLQNVIKF